MSCCALQYASPSSFVLVDATSGNASVAVLTVLYGGNVYVVTTTLAGIHAVYKSTDIGVTWAVKDAAHKPGTTYIMYDAVYNSSGNKITVLLASGSPRFFNLIDFDLTTDTWGSVYAVTSFASGINLFLPGISHDMILNGDGSISIAFYTSVSPSHG